MSEHLDNSIAEANRLMEAGAREKAKTILTELIEQNEPSEELYENVIYNYLLGGCYAEAMEISKRYELEFGEKPTPEISLQAIAEKQRKQRAIEDRHEAAGSTNFQRLTIKERRGLSRYLLWRGKIWQEVRVEPREIVLVKRRRIYRLPWEEIRSTSLKKERSFVGENRSYIKKVVVLRTAQGKTYEIDVSTTFPEFARPRVLEEAIKSYLSVEEGEVEEWDETRGMLGGLSASLILLLIGALVLWLVNAFF